MPDFLAVGSDADHAIVPMNGITAQRVADAFNCVLPTKKMVGLIYRQARAQGTALYAPHIDPPGAAMMSIDYYRRHDATIKERRRALVDAGHALGTLVAGHKKNVVVSKDLDQKRYAGRLAYWGWYLPDGRPVQNFVIGHHEDAYADYSHGVRMVHKGVEVDGSEMEMYELLAHPVLHALVSDEGALDMSKLRYRNYR